MKYENKRTKNKPSKNQAGPAGELDSPVTKSINCCCINE